MADEGDGDAAARAGEDVLGGADERGLGLGRGRHQGRSRCAAKSASRWRALRAVRDAHARRVQHERSREDRGTMRKRVASTIAAACERRDDWDWDARADARFPSADASNKNKMIGRDRDVT